MKNINEILKIITIWGIKYMQNMPSVRDNFLSLKKNCNKLNLNFSGKYTHFIFIYILNEIIMNDIFKQIDKTALTTQRNTSLKAKIRPIMMFSGTEREEVLAGGPLKLRQCPLTMWKIEFLFVLNSLFNLRMKLPNNSIYLSITFGLGKKAICVLTYFILVSALDVILISGTSV